MHWFTHKKQCPRLAEQFAKAQKVLAEAEKNECNPDVAKAANDDELGSENGRNDISCENEASPGEGTGAVAENETER